MPQQLILELAPVAPPTFANFIPGANAAAVDALRAMATGQRAGEVIYLWGEPASGRSHLLAAAVGAASAAGCPAVLVHSGADLPQAMARADAALIALDDVDLLDATAQIGAFDLFNAGRATGMAIVAAGKTAPQRSVVREDLRTRLASGLVFEITALSDEEKQTALRQYARARGMALGDEVIAYLFTRLRRDLGTQLAALDALDRYALAQRRAVTLPLARAAIAALAMDAPVGVRPGPAA